MMAKAVWDKIPLNLLFNRQIWKFLVSDNSDTEFGDLRDFDSALYNSLKYMNENSIDGNPLIEQYFVHEHEDGTVHQIAVNGATTKVSDDNKFLFSIVKTEYITKEIVSNQLTAIKRGFTKLIPVEWISSFTAKDLEFAVCGRSEISLTEWQANTQYKGSYYNGHQVITWFWDCLKTYNQEQLSRLLQFCTGTSRLPAGGFR